MDPDIYLVHSWDQGDFLSALAYYAHAHGTKVEQKLDSGMCQTLSLKWIQLKLQEVQQHQRADSATRMGEMTYNLYEVAKIQEQETTPFATQAKNAYRLRETGYPKNVNADYVAATVTHASRSCYMAILDLGDESEKHAIAMYQSSGKIFGINKHVYIFDPNYGEYKVLSASFGDWLKAFLERHYNNAQIFDEFYGYSLR